MLLVVSVDARGLLDVLAQVFWWEIWTVAWGECL